MNPEIFRLRDDSRMRNPTAKSAVPDPARSAPGRREVSLRVGSHDQEFVECRLCRRPFRIISISHVRYKHGIDLDEYLGRFPEAILFSADTRGRISERVTEHFERLGRHWTPDRIREAIGRRQRDRKPLNARSVFLQDKALYEAAYSHFHSWDKALRVSGVNPKEVRRKRHWTTSEILGEIRRLSETREYAYGSRMLRRHYGLVQAAAAAFGSWRAAVEKAGVVPLIEAPLHWTRRSVIDRIHELARRSESLRTREVNRREARLLKAARRLFRESWPELIRKLGYPYPQRVTLGRQGILRILRCWERDIRGLPGRTVEHRLRNLSAAVRKHFASWEAALDAARTRGA
jgi:hypothetical protein